jgi:hypothetical protein
MRIAKFELRIWGGEIRNPKFAILYRQIDTEL